MVTQPILSVHVNAAAAVVAVAAGGWVAAGGCVAAGPAVAAGAWVAAGALVAGTVVGAGAWVAGAQAASARVAMTIKDTAVSNRFDIDFSSYRELEMVMRASDERNDDAIRLHLLSAFSGASVEFR